MRVQPVEGILVPEAKIPVTFVDLVDVPYLREDIVRHHLQEWPNTEGRLDPAVWGWLGDPPRPLEPGVIPYTLVATLPDGRYIGKGSIIPHDLDHPDYRQCGPWMGGLSVLPEHRGRGVGKCLHFNRLAWAAKKGCKELWLFTEQRPYKTYELYMQVRVGQCGRDQRTDDGRHGRGSMGREDQSRGRSFP